MAVQTYTPATATTPAGAVSTSSGSLLDAVAAAGGAYAIATVNGRMILCAPTPGWAVPGDATISRVSVLALARNATGATNRTIRSILRFDSNNSLAYYGDTTTITATEASGLWQTYTHDYLTNPHTAAAWTPGDLGGSGLTDFAVNFPSANGGVHCDACWLEVEYTQPAEETTGALDATLPDASISTPTGSWSGTATGPATTGTLDAALPSASATTPTCVWAGTVEPPESGGGIHAALPAAHVAVPAAAWTGAYTAPPPSFTGELAAVLPDVTAGVPAVDWQGAASGIITPLQRWRDAIAAAAAGTGLARIGFIGDSYFEGVGASDRAHRWIDRLATQMRAQHTIDGSALWHSGYWYDGPGGDTDPATTGAQSSSDAYLGRRGVVLDAGEWIEWPITGNSVDLHAAAASGGSLLLSVAGTTLATWPADGNTRRYDWGTAAARTVRITAAGATIGVHGIIEHTGDPDRGLDYLESTRGGATSAYWAPGTGAITALRDASPHLIVWSLYGNDFLPSAGTASPATVASRLAATLADIATWPQPPHVAILLYWGLSYEGPNDQSATHADYRAALRGVATSHGAQIIDLSTTYQPAPAGMIGGDGVHPTDTGHQAIADYVQAALAEPGTGAIAAELPAAAVSAPSSSWTGTATVPQTTGTLDATTPAAQITPPTLAWTGTTTAPIYSGLLDADTPAVLAAVPITTWAGTATTPGEGTLAAALPTITAGTPTTAWSGTATTPKATGALTAPLPIIGLGTPGAAWTGTHTPPTPTTTTTPPSRTLYITADDRTLTIDRHDRTIQIGAA